MKMMQQDGDFRPIALVLETEEDARRLWDIVSTYATTGSSEGAYQMAVKISNWFSNEAKL